MSDRVPCKICQAMILPDTATRHGGLCAQCVKDPEGTRFELDVSIRFEKSTLADYKTELTKAVKESVEHVLDYYRDETIYGYALYTSGDYVYVTDTVFTEAGLTQVAENYHNKYGDQEGYKDIETCRQRLRWSPCDAPAHSEREHYFAVATQIMGWQWGLHEEEEEEATTNAILKVCSAFECMMLELLNELRSSGVFGDDVFLCLMEGDQSIEQRIAYGEKLNSLETVQRYADEQVYPIDPEELDLSRTRLNTTLEAGYEPSQRMLL